jgi:serine/threonine protein phosphatase PrpC
MPITLQAAAITDRGQIRETNEDTAFQCIVEATDSDATGLFVVADGIGGRLEGEVASYWAVEAVKKNLSDMLSLRDPRETVRFESDEITDSQSLTGDASDTLRLSKDEILAANAAYKSEQDYLASRIKTAVEYANGVVRRYASHKLENASDAGTTITLALVTGPNAFVANVGDSRTYLVREGHPHQITRDHSYVQRLIEEGLIDESDRFDHPHRNLIHRSLGSDDEVQVDTFNLKLLAGDYLLLCTDGLWEMIHDASTMAAIIAEAPTPAAACQSLVEEANRAGGEDNVGVVVVKVLRDSRS